MWPWIVQNKEWLFSGAGISALGIIWWVFTKLRGSKRESLPVRNNVTSTASPHVELHQHFEPKIVIGGSEGAGQKNKEEKQDVAQIDYIQSRAVLLHETGTGVYYEAAENLEAARKGIVAQFKNIPKGVGERTPKASSVTAKMLFRDKENPEAQELHISHGVWLNHYEHFATLRSGETQQLLVAVKLVPFVTYENPNSSNPFSGRWRPGISVRHPQAIILPGREGELEITLVDAWGVTVFKGLFDYKFSVEEMSLKRRV